MNQKNFVLYMYTRQENWWKRILYTFFICWSACSTCVSKVLLYFTFIFALTVFFCAVFFQLILLFLKHALFSSSTFHSSLLPTERSWNEPTLPFLLLSLSHTTPLLFQLLQTDSQASDRMSWASPLLLLPWHALLPCPPVRSPLFFSGLVWRLKGLYASPVTPSFTKFLLLCRVNHCGNSLLSQVPWEQRLCFTCIPVTGSGVLELFLSAR